MKFREFYRQNKDKYLAFNNINDYVFRVLIMKEAEIDGDMSQFFIAEDKELQNEKNLLKNLERVINGEPYQYVVQDTTFLGRHFYVDKRVLIPRLETEELVSELIKTINEKHGEEKIMVADIGTGSGAIAITIAKKVQNAIVFGSDISNDALDVAKINAKSNFANVQFVHSDMLDYFIKNNIKLDVLVSNPPYINNIEEVDKSVLNYEPHLALFAKNGIDYYDIILKNAHTVMNKDSIIAFEFNYDQKDKIQDLIKLYIPHSTFKFYKDFDDKWRYVIIKYCANE